MTEQESGTHGARQDDALKREVHSELQAKRATRAEEWLEPEPPDEDEPEATWALTGRPGGTQQDADAIELRSALAAHLERAAFPATRQKLLDTLAAHQAEQRFVDLVSSAPEDVTFANFGELARALGMPVEHRPG
jgi:hypothetical protein